MSLRRERRKIFGVRRQVIPVNIAVPPRIGREDADPGGWESSFARTIKTQTIGGRWEGLVLIMGRSEFGVSGC